MTIILDIVVPVFGLVLLAYAAARLGYFPEGASRGLSLFVFNFAIPALLFRTMASTELPTPIDWGYLLSYFGASFAGWGAAMAVSALLFRRDLAAASIAGMTAGFSNAVQLGIPLVLTTFGEVASLPLFLLIACHSTLFMTAVTVLLETARGGHGRVSQIPVNIARGLATNPIVVAMVLGIVWNLAGLGIPGPVDAVLATLGEAALACALFASGARLAGYHIAGALPEAAAGVAFKLLVHPALVWLLARFVFDVEPLWRDVAVLVAALPVGVNVYLFADRYEAGTAPAATAMLISTLLSVGTVALVLQLMAVR